MTFSVIAKAEAVLAGTFLARAVYGAEYIDPAFHVGGDGDAELNDDYAGYVASQGAGWEVLTAVELPNFDNESGDSVFTANGLYNARVKFGPDHSFDAQGLLAVKGDALVLTFRGTDREDPVVEDGTTFVAASLAAHYKAFRSLIDAAYDYLDSHEEITEIVVSGHSLGGAMVDIFTMVDAARFRDLRPDGVTLVSVASSGVARELPTHMKNYDFDPAVVDVDEEEIFGIPTGVLVIDSVTPPPDYISLSNEEDRAHFARDFPAIPEDDGLVPIVTLKDNAQFGADVIFSNPNIDNADVSYLDPDDHPLDHRGLGAEHNSALVWANLQGLTGDVLKDYYSDQDLIFGITDYNNAVDWDGSPVPLFEGYLFLGDAGFDDDKGSLTLNGDRTGNYIMGLTGNDAIVGRAGHDLLSGGDGRDRLGGGGGNDKLAGGLGKDVHEGGAGADRFVFTSLAHSLTGNRSDAITDFSTAEEDRIDVRDIDARAGVADDQAFAFMAGADTFSGEGQIIALQSDDDTILRFNTSGNGGSEMDILLKGVIAADLSGDQFIL